jgi:hypothetical protein
MSAFSNIYNPRDVFVVQPCDGGGWEASYGTKYSWLRHAHNAQEACQHALAEFGKAGYAPLDLVKSMEDGPMKKTMESYCREVLKKHRGHVKEIEEHKTSPKEAPAGYTKYQAMEYLVKKCEEMQRAEEEQMAKSGQHRSLHMNPSREIGELSWLVGRIEIMHESEWRASTYYEKLCAEMKANGFS